MTPRSELSAPFKLQAVGPATLVVCLALLGCGGPAGRGRGGSGGGGGGGAGGAAGGDNAAGLQGGDGDAGDAGAQGGDQGGGDQAAGDQGAGDQGAGDQGAGVEGAGDQGAGDQGGGEEGAGDPGGQDGGGDLGAGDEGGGDEGAGDEGGGNEGGGDEGGGDEGGGDEGGGDQGDGEPCEGQTFVDDRDIAGQPGDPCHAPGACARGSVECAAATNQLRCSTAPGGSEDDSEPEECNGLDDDCDGAIDNAPECDEPPDDDRSVTLCDEDWAQAEGVEHGGICGVPGDEDTSYWLDFDRGRKVRPQDASADLSKGHVNCCDFGVHNGAQQVLTDIAAGLFQEIPFPCSPEMAWSEETIEHNLPGTNVVCVRTASGGLFAYVGEFECCGDNIIHWRTAE